MNDNHESTKKWLGIKPIRTKFVTGIDSVEIDWNFICILETNCDIKHSDYIRVIVSSCIEDPASSARILIVEYQHEYQQVFS
jgi:hypothetical protein